MRTIYFFSLLALLACHGAANCQESTSSAGRRQLQLAFRDDFVKNTRSAYKIQGQVSWTAGKLTLREGSSIARAIDGGAWAKVECGLHWPQLSKAAPQSELRIWFQLDGASDCFVRLRQTWKDGRRTASVALIDTGKKNGKTFEQVVRESPTTTDIRRVRVVYRYGLVVVSQGIQNLLSAHIEHDAATVRQVVLGSFKRNIVCETLSAFRLRRTLPAFTAEQEKRLARARKADNALTRLYGEAKYAAAAKQGEQSLQIKKELLGEEHIDYAASLYNLATVYTSMGDYARALPLYKQTIEIEKAALGEKHPSYAASLGNLAQLYKNMSDYARAEPLYKQAMAIEKATLGEKHPSYGISLNNLATLYESTAEYVRAEPLYKQAIEITKATLGKKHPSYAASLGNLAGLYRAMGKYARALPLYKQAMAIEKATLGEKHPDYATSLNNLAGLYQNMAEYDRAEVLYKQALEIKKATPGEKHPDYATSLSNLALLYEKMGDYARALPLYKQAMAIEKASLGEKHPDYAISLNNLAGLYENMAEYDRAERLYKQALEIKKATLGEKHPDYATSLSNLAGLYESRGNYDAAERLYKQAMEIDRICLGEQHPNYAISLNNLSQLYKSMGDYVRAVPLCKQAIEIKKATLGEKHPDYATSLNNLAGLYEDMAEYDRAEVLYLQTLSILKSSVGEKHSHYATTLNNLAHLYQGMADHVRAETLYKQSMAIRKSLLGEKHPSYAASLNNLAMLYESTAQYARAEPLFKQTLEIERVTLGEEHPSYANSLNNLALLYQHMGDYARAEPLYQQSMAIRKSVLGEKHPDYAASLNNLVGLYKRMGDYGRAVLRLRQALQIYKETVGEKHPDYSTVLNNLASLYAAMRDYARAEPLYKQSIEIEKATRGENHPSYAISLDNLAALYERMGRFARAERLYKQAIQIYQATLGEKHPSYTTTLNNLAFLYERMGDYDRAERLFKRSMETDKATLGENHPAYATSLTNLGLLYEIEGDYVRAEAFSRQAVAIARRQLDANSLVQSERQQKRNQSKKRGILDWRLTNALRAGERPNDALQTMWRWKGAVTFRQQAYRAVSANHELKPLFESLRSVSRQLSALSAQIPLAPPKSATKERRQNYRRLLGLWEKRFKRLNQEREDLERKIAAESQEFREVNQALRVETVQNLLPAATAYVDFLDYNHSTPAPDKTGKANSERRYVAFVVRKDRPAVVIGLGSTAVLAEAIKAFRRPFLAERSTPANRKQATTAGRRLRQRLWLPLEKHLDGIKTVIISPDTVLGTLPFAALPGRRADSFLLEDYRLARIPFANLLPVMARRKASPSGNRGLLVVGDVDYDADSGRESDAQAPRLLALASQQGQLIRSRGRKSSVWNSLPGFGQELKIVKSLYQQHFGAAARISTLSGADANETSLLQAASKYRTLHLVTHGYFEDADAKSIGPSTTPNKKRRSQSSGPDRFINAWIPGLLSGLVLAGANKPLSDPSDLNDGILRASEIEAASLRGVDLVILSACETGLGAVAGGEGLTGLQRAFQMAGAHSVIASLWKVEDTATQELIRRFYINLWQKKMSKVDALREAQLWMLKHPRELEAMGVKSARTRGRPRDLKTANPAARKGSSFRTDPFFWAAFQLSGDWR